VRQHGVGGAGREPRENAGRGIRTQPSDQPSRVDRPGSRHDRGRIVGVEILQRPRGVLGMLRDELERAVDALC
jgi:hypothetical protein